MEKIIYSKYSDDRAPEFAIRTDIIINEKNEKKVCKKASYQEGITHIKNMYYYYKELNKEFEDGKLLFNKCCLEGEKLILEFLEGETLRDRIENFIADKEFDKIYKTLSEYICYIKSKATENFVITEEFKKVFGRVDETKLDGMFDTAKSLKVSDIDMIPANIIINDNWNVIDYEWTFDFPIPVNYIIYRILFFTFHQNTKCEELSMERLMKIGSFSKREIRLYDAMEDNFQEYILKNVVPIRKMRDYIGNNIYTVEELKHDLDSAFTEIENMKNTRTWKMRDHVRDILGRK